MCMIVCPVCLCYPAMNWQSVQGVPCLLTSGDGHQYLSSPHLWLSVHHNGWMSAVLNVTGHNKTMSSGYFELFTDSERVDSKLSNNVKDISCK